MAHVVNEAKKVLLLSLCVVFLCGSLAYADELSDSNRIFNWAEKNYQQYFPVPSSGNNETVVANGYIYRYYEQTGNYLITYEKKFYVYGEMFGGVLEVGSINSFLSIVDCNEFQLDPPDNYSSVSAGESVNAVHHKNIAGYTITGHYYVNNRSEGGVEKLFSIYFRCDRTHKTTIDGVGITQGSFVADYDNSNQPTIYLYDSSGGQRHILSLSNMSIDISQSRFDIDGQIDSITKTFDCEDSGSIKMDEITCDKSEYPGYLFCQYSFQLANNPNLGRWQHESFFHSMKNAGELTEEINRFGAHVDLTDGAAELKIFQRGDDMSLSKPDINNESTLTIEKDGRSHEELKYRKKVPDNEARDMLMTYLPENDEQPENFRVHLKTGKGIAPIETDTVICPEPANCCYGNHCLHQYDRSGNNWGQYLGTRIYFGFYAPIAGATCKVEPEERNDIMTTIDVEFKDPSENSDTDDHDDQDSGSDEKKRWNFTVNYSSYYGSGTMQIDNFTVDPDCSEAEDSFCIFVSNDYADQNINISYTTDLLYDSDLAPLLVYKENGKITMDWSAIVSPSWGEGFSAQIGGSPYADAMLGFCNGDLPADAQDKFRNGTGFNWRASIIQDSEETVCTYSFMPYKQ
ncbi:MAG: hypothetical protein HQK62_03595 [Desulfamplus sp.]|nr:hypothetical protein [Desulfamplus sp.]